MKTPKLKTMKNKINLTLLRRVLSEPWCMTEETLHVFAQLLINGDAVQHVGPAINAIQPGYVAYNYEGKEAGKLPTVPAGVNVSLVWGTLGRAWTSAEKFWLDAIDVDDLVDGILSSPAKKQVLWFRSPGGISTGIPEAAAAIREARAQGKTVIAFTDELMASAAYWLGAQAAEIVATPTAHVGSIGVYTAFYDFTRMMENAGVSLELFKAGSLKATGLMGKPLSDEERSMIQSRVDAVYAEFAADVTRKRDIRSEAMQGQTFTGPAAKSEKLIDRTVASASKFFASLG
jgi:signal peptide peptidase SppA